MSEKIIDQFYEELDSYIDFELLDCLNNYSDGMEKEYHVYLAELKKEHLQTEPEQGAIILQELSEAQFKIYDTLASKHRWNPYLEVVFGVLSKDDTENCYLAVSEFIPRPTSLDYQSLSPEKAVETRSLTLEQYVESFGCLSEKEALIFLFQLCEAISLLRKEDFVHGDISPRNILLTDRIVDDNEFDRFRGIHRKISVKLIDFDITKSVEISDHTITSAVGTFPYAAPEIIDFKNPTDRADIYSLGCIFCFMLTGKSPKDIGWKKISKDWSESAYRIFTDCTANYEMRYSSPSKLKKDIRRLLCYPDNDICNVIRQVPGFRSRNPIKMAIAIHGLGIYRVCFSAVENIVPSTSDLYFLVLMYPMICYFVWFNIARVTDLLPSGLLLKWQQLKKLSPVMACLVKLAVFFIVGSIIVIASS